LTESLWHSFHIAAPAAQLVNLYGCTEVPEVSWAPLDPALDFAGRDAPIGRPIPGSTVTIVDENLQPVASGEIGELLVNSPLMAQGYFQRPAETAARFLDDPLAPGGRRYRTGDRVYQTADGLLHYVGRLDHLVKIRGYRVELPEVETALLQADPAIKHGVVVVREDPQLAENKQLIAFVTPATVDLGALQATLQQRLPAYMIPEQIIPLNALPLTPSGKVDRQALLATVQPMRITVAAAAPPREIITHLWRAILQREQVHPQTNFFEAGGNSLRLAQLHQQLRAFFVERAPSLTLLLQYPTLDTLVAYFEQPTVSAKAAPTETAQPSINRQAAARQLRARRQGNQ
jgi:aryl carrier-like protein